MGKQQTIEKLVQRVQQMKISGGTPKASVTRVIKELTVLGVDPSLLSTLQAALMKPVSELGAFDNLTFENFDAEMAARLTNVEATLARLAPGKQEREVAVSDAKGALGNAKESIARAK